MRYVKITGKLCIYPSISFVSKGDREAMYKDYIDTWSMFLASARCKYPISDMDRLFREATLNTRISNQGLGVVFPGTDFHRGDLVNSWLTELFANMRPVGQLTVVTACQEPQPPGTRLNAEYWKADQDTWELHSIWMIRSKRTIEYNPKYVYKGGK